MKYVCTDPSRNIFKYKDDSGDIHKDIEAKKLTNYLIDGGIKNKSLELAKEWYTADDGIVDKYKLQILLDKHDSLVKLDEDNSEFRKELISQTSL